MHGSQRNHVRGARQVWATVFPLSSTAEERARVDPGARERPALHGTEVFYALEPEIDHSVDVLPWNRFPLRRALDLDDRALRRGHEVQIDSRRAVLRIAQVESEPPIDVAHADCGNLIPKHPCVDRSGAAELVDRQGESDEATGDGCRPGPPVRLQDVAIDDDAALTEAIEIDGRPQRPPDQPLDFAGSASQRTLPPVPVLATFRVGTRMHLILRRQPSPPLAPQEVRNGLVDRSGDEDGRPATSIEDAAFGQTMKPRLDLDRSNSRQVPALALVARHDGQTYHTGRVVPSSSMRPPAKLRVSEIFTSIQGEGPTAGEPAAFLRLALCNLRCRWCDTKYTWDFENFDYALEVHPMAPRDVLQRLEATGASRLVITGGEPLMQQRGLIELVRRAPDRWTIEVETNGTLAPDPALLARVSQWNVSPKLQNCGEPRDRRLRHDVLGALLHTGSAWLKCVVESDADVDELEVLVASLRWPRSRVLLMPQAASRSLLRERHPAVAEIARARGFGLSPRLHIEQFDGARGV